MIRNKQEFKEYVAQDWKAYGRPAGGKASFFDFVWKYQYSMRKLEYYFSMTKMKRTFFAPAFFYHKYRYILLGMVLGISIPTGVFDKGLVIVHYGTLIVSPSAKAGKNCRIHEGVTIGETNGRPEAATIGDNVFIGSGAKILGDVTIADDVAIAANAVVTKSITEPGTTWGGIPARKISDNNSHSNLSKALFE